MAHLHAIGMKLAAGILLVNSFISAKSSEYIVLATVGQNARQAKWV